MGEKKLHWLEVMRGLAAVWVLVYHGVLSVNGFIGSLGSVPLMANGKAGALLGR